MTEVAHLFICDRAYEDDRGQPCVIGMFDHIRSASFPHTQPQLVVAAQMVGHHDEGCDVTVEVLDPQHHVLVSSHNDAPAPLSEIGTGALYRPGILRRAGVGLEAADPPAGGRRPRSPARALTPPGIMSANRSPS